MPPLDLIQLGISSAIPALVAVLNDPRPNRAWLRVLIVVAVVGGAAALHIWQKQSPLTWQSWGSEALALMLGSQLVHRLLKVPFGKLEEGSGNGVGVLIDGILRGTSEEDKTLEATLIRLETLKAKVLITPQEYETMRAQAIKDAKL